MILGRVLLLASLTGLFGACTPGATTGIAVAVPIHAQAGPVCPVERVPPDPACADRPVADAQIVVTDAAGTQVASGMTNAAGDLVLRLPAGSYVVTPQRAPGVMGTASAVPIQVVAGASQAPVVVVYDTGIR
jgi:hypothetical protein